MPKLRQISPRSQDQKRQNARLPGPRMWLPPQPRTNLQRPLPKMPQTPHRRRRRRQTHLHLQLRLPRKIRPLQPGTTKKTQHLLQTRRPKLHAQTKAARKHRRKRLRRRLGQSDGEINVHYITTIRFMYKAHGLTYVSLIHEAIIGKESQLISNMES